MMAAPATASVRPLPPASSPAGPPATAVPVVVTEVVGLGDVEVGLGDTVPEPVGLTVGDGEELGPVVGATGPRTITWPHMPQFGYAASIPWILQ